MWPLLPIEGNVGAIGGRSVPYQFAGAILRNAADSASTNFSSIVVGWDTEILDTDAAHSTVSNTSRITIPAAFDGKYGIFHACIYLTSVAGTDESLGITFLKNSAAFDGIARMILTCDQFAVIAHTVETPPVFLTTSDIFEISVFCNDPATVLEADYSTFSLMVIS